MAVFSKPWTPVSTILERIVLGIPKKEIPKETDWSQSIEGSWYIDPVQHGLELTLFSTGFGAAAWYYLKKVTNPSNLAWKLLTSFKPKGPATKTEVALTAALIGSFAVTLIHKIKRRNKLFLLQPCHMSAALLLLNLLNPNKSAIIPNLLFNIYLHTQWGAIAALIFPDLRDHYLIGETTNFFAEHILILLAPAYMIYSGRYLVLPTSKNMALLSFFVYSFFHSPVLHLCALRWNQNLNYLFSPPPIKFLLQLGRGYRVALYSTALGAMFATRYAYVPAICSLLPKKAFPTRALL